MDSRRSSKPLLAAGALLLAAAAILVLSTRRDRPAQPAVEHQVQAAEGDVASAARSRLEAARQRAASDGVAGPPVIDAVVIEKTALCEGEENLVTIQAHAADRRDDVHLRGVVDGTPGMTVPLVAHKRSASSPPPEVVVFGQGGTRVTAPIPPFVVKDCTAPSALALGYRLRVNTNAEFDFDAKITSRGTPFVATSYTWDFGDGTTVTSLEPFVVHDYGQRPQVSLYSNLLVQVTAHAAGGTLVGRRSIVFRNPAYANLVEAGVVTLVVELTPRFPTIKGDRIEQGVRLWHHRPKPVRIERIRARRNSSVAGAEPVVAEVPVKSILGTDVIPPSGIRFQLTLDTKAEPELSSIDYLLDGKSAEGHPVQSVFSVMRPPVPTPDRSVPVDDPSMVAKILRAREILEKDYVTDEDMMALQRKGVFDDFKPAPSPQPPKLPPVYTGGRR